MYPKPLRGKSGAGLFGDVMMEVDWSVGEIMKALRQHKLEKNTLFLFTSDNGPWLNYGDHAGSAGSSSEKGRGTMFDGGCREPTLIAWWPGTVPANSVCTEPAMTIDLLPTIAKLSGAELPGREHGREKHHGLYLLLEDEAKITPGRHTISITGISYRQCGKESGSYTFLTWIPNHGGKARGNGGDPNQLLARDKSNLLFLTWNKISEKA